MLRTTIALMLAAAAPPAFAAEDLSQFGRRVENPGAWPQSVCAEILRTEKTLVENARPGDRGMLRIGLLTLEQRHCGIDVSKKMADDQKVLSGEQARARREYEENMDAAARVQAYPTASPVIVEVPQASPVVVPAPAAPMNCTTTRLGGGMSTTNCR